MKTLDNTHCTKKIIKKSLIINYLIELLTPDQVDKTAFRDLVSFMLGILLTTPHNSTLSFSKTVLGAGDASNLNKSLHAYADLYQQVHLFSIIQAIIWCTGFKEVRPGTPVYVSVDEVFLPKSKKQKSLPYVYYCAYKKQWGFYLVVAHVQIGKYHLSAGFRIYNPKNEKSKQTLALELVNFLAPHLKQFCKVTFLADSAYAEKNLMRYVIEGCCWTWISGIKQNRLSDGKSVRRRFKYLSNSHYQSVCMYKRKFVASSYVGHLKDFSEVGLFVVTKTKKRTSTPVSWRYYYCSDQSLSVQEVLRLYENRWRIENDFWTLKEHLAIDDFRYRDESAVQTYLSLVFLVYNWICHEKNASVRRMKQSEIGYGCGPTIVRLRSWIGAFFHMFGTDGLRILQEEFRTARSRQGGFG